MMKLRAFGPAILVTLIGFIIAWQFVNPAPPRYIRIATGSAEGAYYLFADRYRERLATEGIELEILATAGAVENLQLLADGNSGVDLAFVQGGLAGGHGKTQLSSLASLYYEPLWVFYRDDAVIDRLPALSGRRLAIGLPDSGTHAVTAALLAANGIDSQSAEMLAIDGVEAAEALFSGQVDAAFLVASPSAPLVQRLLQADGIRLMDFSRAAAYTR